MSVPKSRRLNRSILVSAVPAGPSIDIWRSCRFLGAMIRALGDLPGGLGRFLPCRIGANHCRLRSIGWERCGDGLTSRPLEASALVYAASLHPLVAGSPGSGDTPSFRNSRDGKRMRIRLTKKTNVRKRFGDDLGEQPIPKRWRADVFRGMVSSGETVRAVHYRVGSSRLSEPMGIG